MADGGKSTMRLFVLMATLVLAACAPAPAANRADAAHGRRLATVMGCVSCHGERLDGHLFEENPAFALAYSSNLSRILPRWSDAQIAATLRTGRRRDGTALWFMPTFAQAPLTDADMRDLIAWLRTVKPTGTDHPGIVKGPQWAVALGHGFSDSAAQATRLAARAPLDAGGATATGRYLARIACAECHGPDLKGPKDPQPGDAPDLVVAAGYTPADFRRLLRTGEAAGGRQVGLMSQEARHRLHALTDAEIGAIHAYLSARAGH
ncbi:c-type cytochrome [Sphingomonas corticis]|jgi:mono/diheme cytochrome c family protein|uniref:C-type cytochrome n=1 Tax=Sphingomonas corticis TaxID=2722791 RepID=A0ABX1CWE0_9SPHN|nr:c-type cytochrome [Sphingomonas corticis]NJR80252.1 c-type cytochrome [Sphingomonas corticis]